MVERPITVFTGRTRTVLLPPSTGTRKVGLKLPTILMSCAMCHYEHAQEFLGLVQARSWKITNVVTSFIRAPRWSIMLVANYLLKISAHLVMTRFLYKSNVKR